MLKIGHPSWMIQPRLNKIPQKISHIIYTLSWSPTITVGYLNGPKFDSYWHILFYVIFQLNIKNIHNNKITIKNSFFIYLMVPVKTVSWLVYISQKYRKMFPFSQSLSANKSFHLLFLWFCFSSALVKIYNSIHI